jgi:hypothetical protein
LLKDKEPLDTLEPPQSISSRAGSHEKVQSDRNIVMSAGTAINQDLPKNIISIPSKGSVKEQSDSGIVESISQISEPDTATIMEVDQKAVSSSNSLKRKSAENLRQKASTGQNLLQTVSNESDAATETKSVKSKKPRTGRGSKERQSPGVLKKTTNQEKKSRRLVETVSERENLVEETGRPKRRKSQPERFGELINSIEINNLFPLDTEIEESDEIGQKIRGVEENGANGIIRPQSDLVANDGLVVRKKSNRRRSKPDRLGFKESETIYENSLANHRPVTGKKAQLRNSEDDESKSKAIETNTMETTAAVGEYPAPQCEREYPESGDTLVCSGDNGLAKDEIETCTNPNIFSVI